MGALLKTKESLSLKEPCIKRKKHPLYFAMNETNMKRIEKSGGRSRISEAKVLNSGKNFFGKVSNFGYNLCPKSWKDFDDDWKKLNNLDIHNFRNNLGNLIINFG